MSLDLIISFLQHLFSLPETVFQIASTTIAQWLGYCATCACPRVGQCIDWGGVLGGLGALGAAGAAGGLTQPNRNDRCAGERRGVQTAQAFVDRDKSQLSDATGQLEKLKGPADELIAQANELAGLAQSEMAWNLVQELITKVLEIAIKASPMGELYEAGSTLVDPSGAIPGSEYIEFFQELVGSFSLLEGGLDAVETRAEEEGLTNTIKFIEKMRELESLRNNAQQILSRIDHIRTDLAGDEQKLQEAQQALTECEAANASARAN